MSLAQGNNTPTRPRIEPGSPDPESDALTTRPVRPPPITFESGDDRPMFGRRSADTSADEKGIIQNMTSADVSADGKKYNKVVIFFVGR